MDAVKNLIWQAKYLGKHNWLQAIIVLQEGIKKHPDTYELYDQLGNIYFNHNVYSKAIKAYQNALRFNPKDEGIHFKLGNSFLSLKEYVLAIDNYDKINIEFPELFYNKAYAFAKIGNLDKSIKLLKRMIKKSNLSQVPYIFLSEIYYTQGKFDLSIKYLIEAERKFGKQGPISYLKGLAFSNLNNWLKSYIAFTEAKKLNTNSYQFYHSYALTCEKIGKIDKAIEYLLHSVKLNASGAASYLELIRIYLNQDRLIEAYSLIQQAKRNIPFSVPLSLLYNQVMQKVKIEQSDNVTE